MTIRALVSLSALLLAHLFIAPLRTIGQPRQSEKLLLSDGWSLQSSAKVAENGEHLSVPAFQPKDWYAVTVPTTVVAALVKHKVYPDPNFGLNLQKIPGASYPVVNLSDLPLEPDGPFAVAWWYRKSFQLPANYKGKTIWLNFEGINYRANIWINGKQIASKDDVAGTWRTYEFDITSIARLGAENVVAVEVHPPTEGDLAISFVDWNPIPPDRDMGVFREVYVRTSGPVALRYPAAISSVNSPANNQAHLTVVAQLKNATDKPVEGKLTAQIEKIAVSQQVELAPGETKQVVFEPGKFSQLNIANPRLWWPAQMGAPNLYELSMEFEVDGKKSDEAKTHFGIREITSALDQNSHLVFSVNGKKILIRGAGWAMDMMLRQDSLRLQDELRYVSDLGLNAIRLEGMLETEEFFDLADRQGILVMAGWSCALWEPWAKWKKEEYADRWRKWKERDLAIAKESQRSQVLRLRGHPSLAAWWNGSDNPPPAEVEEMYLGIEKEYLWPNPSISSASAQPTSVSGKTGVKMTGPYEYVAPSYWLEDTKQGGAFGFNTETNPGPAIPPIETLRRMLPKEHLWPIDEWWNFHGGGEPFDGIHIFADALNARYGAANDVQDFAFKSQLMSYEGTRAMYEAFSRNKYTSTGVFHWLLNSAWPSLVWHLYDFELRPAGGYFGAKKALEPLHALYSYTDRSIWVVSSKYQDVSDLKLTAKVYNMDMAEKFSREATLDIAADSTKIVFTLPQLEGVTPVYFVRLTLENMAGKLVSSNLYWLSTTPESIDWNKSNWYMVPTASYADFTALWQLPIVRLKLNSRTERKNGKVVTHVIVENPTQSLAFFVHLKANNATDGEEILPVLWQDNYFSLMPGEKREVTVEYRAQDASMSDPVVSVEGWNVAN
jgi:exo-1,4-beta-D-glucosaminidase